MTKQAQFTTLDSKKRLIFKAIILKKKCQETMKNYIMKIYNFNCCDSHRVQGLFASGAAN